MKKVDKILNLILPVLTIACIFLVWGITAKSVDNPFILPSIKEVAISCFALFTDKAFYLALLKTLLSSLISFLISFALAFLTAYLTKKSAKAEVVLRPIIAIIRALPTVAVVLMLYLWTTSDIAPVVVTMLVVYPTLYQNVKQALDTTDDYTLEMCKIFNVSKKDVLLKVQLPLAAPDLLSAIGSGLSLNLKLMVAAEVLSSTANCLGFMLNQSKIYYEQATLIALVVIVIAVGLIIDGTFNLLSKKAGKWKW